MFLVIVWAMLIILWYNTSTRKKFVITGKTNDNDEVTVERMIWLIYSNGFFLSANYIADFYFVDRKIWATNYTGTMSSMSGSMTGTLQIKWDPKNLEIRTKSVEKTLEPLVTQVNSLSFFHRILQSNSWTNQQIFLKSKFKSKSYPVLDKCIKYRVESGG